MTDLLIAGQPAVIVKTGPKPRWAVIWLHGLGADGHDFAPLVPELISPDWPAIQFVFPHAPSRAVTINRGMVMPAWYDITTLDRKALGEAPGMRDTIKNIHAVLDELISDGFSPEQIFLAGFSQGGAIAYAAGLRYSKTLAGIIALSTYLPLMENLESEAQAANEKTPIFAAHGSQDPVVPLQLGVESVRHLQKRGQLVEWHTFPMGHSVCAEEIQDLHVWMANRGLGKQS